MEGARRSARFKVGPIADGVIDSVVSRYGVVPMSLDREQCEVLSSPHALYLWEQLFNADRRPPVFRTLTDLMRQLWTAMRRNVGELKAGAYEQVIAALVEHMDRNGMLQAPPTVVARWPDEVAPLISLNLDSSITVA